MFSLILRLQFSPSHPIGWHPLRRTPSHLTLQPAPPLSSSTAPVIAPTQVQRHCRIAVDYITSMAASQIPNLKWMHYTYFGMPYVCSKRAKYTVTPTSPYLTPHSLNHTPDVSSLVLCSPPSQPASQRRDSFLPHHYVP